MPASSKNLLLLSVVCCLISATLQLALSDERVTQPEHVARIKAGTSLFRDTVRKILTDRCLSCHGGEVLEGQFNLATRAQMLKGGEKGVAVVPGESTESRLYRMVAHIEKPHMPYDEERLPEAEIAAIARWIDLEAPYDKPLIDGPVELQDWTQRSVADDERDFWAFRPLASPKPPEVNLQDWCRTDVDRFILNALEEHHLVPNTEADRRALIRRVWFGLVGLPPTPAEVQQLLQNESPDWYDRMVEDLLSNPHFGERWARHWLDIARFGESHGFEQDYDREFAYHYRDFVIRAFNDDMPFDQFIRWQLAGDELAPEDPLALMATGFLGAGVFPTQLTEKEFEPARYDELDDMVSTMGTAMLGLTIGCARCHDHKFDPIPAADYYRLISTFGRTIRSNIEVDLNPAETANRLARWEAEREPLIQKLREFEERQLGARFDQWLSTAAADELSELTKPEWLMLHVSEATSAGGATLTVQSDESILATGANPDFDTYTLTAESQLPDIRSIRLEALSHASMVRGGPGRADNGNMGLSRIMVTAAPLNGETPAVPVQLINPRATFEQNQSNLSIAASLDDARQTGWAVDPQFGKDHAAAFDFSKPVGFAGGTRLTVTLEFNVNNRHNIGRARLSISNAREPLPPAGPAHPQALAELQQFLVSGDQPTPEQRTHLIQLYRTIDPEWQRLSAAVSQHDQQKPTAQLTKVMVSSEGVPPIPHHADGRGFPHFYKETFFLKRGDTSQKIRVAEPGVLQVLASGKDDSRWNVEPPDGSQTTYQRTGLAKWISDTENGAGHLLARVIVNRLWQHHMGRGLVSTPNDFGRQGELPTHPALLDFLAQKLIDENWQLKSIHRLILTSAVYRQGTDFDAQRSAADPNNLWYWRREPRRLEAEVIRDSMLAVAGQLDPTPFGPGTLDPGHKRRSIYFKVKRSRLIPMMQIFDSPEPLASVANRPSTTIASQALMFMNSPQVRGYAEGFASRIQSDPGNDVIERAYERGLSRQPTAAERTVGEAFLAAQAESYLQDGKSPPEAQRLALTDFCQSILSLNEFIYIE